MFTCQKAIYKSFSVIRPVELYSPHDKLHFAMLQTRWQFGSKRDQAEQVHGMQ